MHYFYLYPMEKIKKTTSFLEVLLFEPDSENITEALGITDERTDELLTILKETLKTNKLKDHPKITDDFYNLSIKVKHVNELSFLLFTYGKLIGSQGAREESGIRSSIILDLLKRFNPGSSSSDDKSTEDPT